MSSNNQTDAYEEGAGSPRFLRLIEVQHQVGLGRSSIYAGIKAGTFPKSYQIGIRARAWASDEIDEWVDSRVQSVGGLK